MHLVSSAGTIYDRNGDVLVTSKDGQREYNNSASVRKATLHVVGDPEGYISTGAQTVFRSQLTGYSLLSGLYRSKDEDKNAANYNITLTVDGQLSSTAYQAMGNYRGTIGVYNYKTGEAGALIFRSKDA